MLKGNFDNSNFPFESPSEEVNRKYHKFVLKKWSNFKHYVAKKRVNVIDKGVYLETLSVESVKRSVSRAYKNIFKTKRRGYEKFLSDEEKRFLFGPDFGLVEGIY